MDIPKLRRVKVERKCPNCGAFALDFIRRRFRNDQVAQWLQCPCCGWTQSRFEIQYKSLLEPDCPEQIQFPFILDGSPPGDRQDHVNPAS